MVGVPGCASGIDGSSPIGCTVFLSVPGKSLDTGRSNRDACSSCFHLGGDCGQYLPVTLFGLASLAVPVAYRLRFPVLVALQSVLSLVLALAPSHALVAGSVVFHHLFPS
jgi:hypothetical protein